MSDRRRFHSIADAELAEDVGDVQGGRLGADEEPLSDLAVRCSRRHQDQYFLLTGRKTELRERRGRFRNHPAPRPIYVKFDATTAGQALDIRAQRQRSEAACRRVRCAQQCLRSSPSDTGQQ